mmetsp:Transcript_25754/g.67438  ORF Transcript_25754/g.67438 Transcript_25754/m.67438 type:complete len:351 (-) Transcript_25754:55-1107(-)
MLRFEVTKCGLQIDSAFLQVANRLGVLSVAFLLLATGHRSALRRFRINRESLHWSCQASTSYQSIGPETFRSTTCCGGLRAHVLNKITAENKTLSMCGVHQFQLYLPREELGLGHDGHRTDSVTRDKVLHAQEPSVHLKIPCHSEVKSAAHEQQTETRPARILDVGASLESGRHRPTYYPYALAQIHFLGVLAFGAPPTQLTTVVPNPEISPRSLRIAIVVLMHRAALLQELLETLHLGRFSLDDRLYGVIPVLSLGGVGGSQDVLLSVGHSRREFQDVVRAQTDSAPVCKVHPANVSAAGSLLDLKHASSQHEVLAAARVFVLQEPSPLCTLAFAHRVSYSGAIWKLTR